MMKTNKKYNYSLISLATALFIMMFVSCERETNGLELATFPTTGEVFIDGFSPGLDFNAWGDVTNFSLDTNEKYAGSTSMRFAVPDEGETGGFAGGSFFIKDGGRDLSEYNALTFWAKASQSAELDVVGFGNNTTGSEYQVSVRNLKVNSNWKKFYIPIPDPSVLTNESGMFYYYEGPENGNGYTFWIDELQFENLGTIAHGQAVILNGEDKVSTAFNGMNSQLDGLGYSFNLPSGVNQTAEISQKYFSFNSSDLSVATVNESGLVNVIAAGESVITATVGGTAAKGSLIVKSTGEFSFAPIPELEAENVISVFSNNYTNVPVDFFNGYWEPYQTTVSADFSINGDDFLNYINLNFVGISFANPPVNGSEMTHLHMDILTKDPVEGAQFIIKVKDFGADGADGGLDDTIVEHIVTPPTLEADKWISLEIPLDGLANKNQIGLIIFESNDNFNSVIVDNIYFYKGKGASGSEPTEAAPSPTADAADVISIYSDAYTAIEGTDYNPGWGQSTVYTEANIAGDNAMLYSGLNYQGIVLGSSQDVSAMEFLHIDFWTDNSTVLNSFLISSGAETAKALTVPTNGWVSIDIPLSDFSPVDLTDIIQLKFDGDGNVYLDNIYFYKSGGSSSNEPTSAAPTPAVEEANVVSIYSDAYSNIADTNFNPGWGQATQQSEVQIAGNNTQLYTNLDYQGIDFAANSFDATDMTHFHMDFWTPNEVLDKVLTVKGVDFGGGSAEASAFELTITHTANGDIPALETGTWVSVDVPITAFSGDLTRADLAQLVFAGSLTDVYIDNIYFYKESSSSSTEPTTAAPTPTVEEANVASIYSDAYTDIADTNFNPGWGQATQQSEVQIAGNNTQLYTNLDYQGIDFAANSFDATDLTHFHMDFWTPNEVLDKVLTVKGVDFGGGSAEASAFELTITHTANGDIPALQTGTWVSVDVPITAFVGDLTRADLAQLVFAGSLTDVYIDNIYFYKEDGSTGDCTDTTLELPINFDCPSIDFIAKIVGNVSFSVIDNPQLSGINNVASKVGSIVNSGENWENAFFNMDTPIDFSTNNTIKFKFYSDVSVDLKLKMEDGTADPVEVDVTHGGTGWEELSFTFSSTDSYNDMVLFVDGPGTTTGTFYIDDIEQVANSGGSGGTGGTGGCTGDVVSATAFPVNFEGCESFTSTFTDGGSITTELVDNPAKVGVNTSDYVLKVVKASGTNRWAGFQNPFPNNFDATKTLKLKVYSTKTNVVMRLEVNSDPQDSGSGNPGPQFVTITNANTWTEIEIVFTGIPDTNTGLNQIVIKPDNPDGTDGETTSSEGIYYFDDIRFE